MIKVMEPRWGIGLDLSRWAQQPLLNVYKQSRSGCGERATGPERNGQALKVGKGPWRRNADSLKTREKIGRPFSPQASRKSEVLLTPWCSLLTPRTVR